MAGTNTIAAKAALLTLLQGEQGSGEPLENVGVDWSYVGKHDVTEYIWLGDQWSGPVQLAAMKGGSAARIRREETITGTVHLKVRTKGQETTRVAETRVVALGAALENVVALDPSLGGVAGLLKATVEQTELQAYTDDDGTVAELTYSIAFHSNMT